MEIFRSDDPVADFNRHSKRQEARIAKLPVCDHCGHPIQDEHLFDIDGELYHESCACNEFRKWTEDYVE